MTGGSARTRSRECSCWFCERPFVFLLLLLLEPTEVSIAAFICAGEAICGRSPSTPVRGMTLAVQTACELNMMITDRTPVTEPITTAAVAKPLSPGPAWTARCLISLNNPPITPSRAGKMLIGPVPRSSPTAIADSPNETMEPTLDFGLTVSAENTTSSGAPTVTRSSWAGYYPKSTLPHQLGDP